MTDASTPPAAPETPEAPPQAPPPALPPAPAAPPATPYRTSLVPHEMALAGRRPSLLGEAVFVFGVLLWGFLVMGELTTSYAPGKHQMLVGEALAVVFVLASTGAAWGVAVRRNIAMTVPPDERAAYLRGAAVALLALVLWGFVVYVAASLGKASSKNMDGPITLFLLILSIACALGGRRLALLHGKASTTRRRWVDRLLWTGSGLLTFVALVEIMGS